MKRFFKIGWQYSYKYFIACFGIGILLTAILYAYNPNLLNVLKDTIKTESVDYIFIVREPPSNKLVDLTSKKAYFKVKRNEADSTFVINEECEIDLYLTISNYVGTINALDTVTGKTSGAIGVVEGLRYEADRKDIVIDVTSGTFASGEQVYKTVDVNYVILSSGGTNSAAVVSLTPTDTNIAAADYYAYLWVENVGGTFKKVGLKSNWKITN